MWPDHAIYAASFPGVAAAFAAGRLPDDALVVSLSRTFGAIDGHRPRRQVWLIDRDAPGTNLTIGAVLDDVVATMDAALAAGQAVIVHCHGGRSRTGLILQAWLLAHSPSMTVDQADAEIGDRSHHLNLSNRSFTAAPVERLGQRRSACSPSPAKRPAR